jgi:hypothetical protein
MSLRKIIKSIIGGDRDPMRPRVQVHGRTKKRHGVQTITDSLDGVINTADVEMLKQYMDQIELIEKQQTACLTH